MIEVTVPDCATPALRCCVVIDVARRTDVDAYCIDQHTGHRSRGVSNHAWQQAR